MIEEFKIGSFKVQGKRYLGDIRIFKGKVHYWDRHKQILRLEDIQALLASNPEVLIIGSGCSGLLEVPDAVINAIKARKIQLFIEKTPAACQRFNTLYKEQKNVAAIFHSTG